MIDQSMEDNFYEKLKKSVKYVFSLIWKSNIIPFLFGIGIGYLFTKPREFLLEEIIHSYEFKFRKRSDELLDTTLTLEKQIEMNTTNVEKNIHLEKE